MCPQVALTAASPVFRGLLTQFDARLSIQMGVSLDGGYSDQVRQYGGHYQWGNNFD